MPKDKLNLWQYMQYYLEDEYLELTGISPYVEGSDLVPTYEYVRRVCDDNADLIGAIGDDELHEWYDEQVLPMLEPKKAPEICDMMQRVINVYFIKEYKFFFNKNNKKSPVDYVLNVDKVIDEKMQNIPPMVFNNVQTFMLNYEIKKLLDKAVTIANAKYDNIVYINARMSTSGVLNIIGHLEKEYDGYTFNYVLLDRENEFADIAGRCNKILVVKNLFQ